MSGTNFQKIGYNISPDFRRMHLLPKLFLLFCLCIPLINEPAHSQDRQSDSVTISYKGNMGVFISSGKLDVLIDGLHDFYRPDYLNTPVAELQKIFQRSGAYIKLGIALFTHFHRDHFSASLTKSFLEASPAHKAGGAPQVVDSLPINQTINAWNRDSIIFSDNSADLKIKSFNIPHTGQQRHSQVQNVAYLLEISGKYILHIGDAETDAAAFEKLKRRKIDVMVVPLWFLMGEGRQIIADIRPRTVIATHISPRETQSLAEYAIPGVKTYFFTTINQAVKI